MRQPALVKSFVYEPEKGRLFDLANVAPGLVVGILFGNMDRRIQCALIEELQSIYDT